MRNTTRLDKIFSKKLITIVAIIASGIVFALMKLNGTPVDQTLRAEDGHIFINQARASGISSLWITYAGYFHLYTAWAMGEESDAN